MIWHIYKCTKFDLPEFVVGFKTLWFHIVNYNTTTGYLSRWTSHISIWSNCELNLHCILYKLLSSFLANRWEWASFRGSTFLTNNDLNQLSSRCRLLDADRPLKQNHFFFTHNIYKVLKFEGFRLMLTNRQKKTPQQVL